MYDMYSVYIWGTDATKVCLHKGLGHTWHTWSWAQHRYACAQLLRQFVHHRCACAESSTCRCRPQGERLETFWTCALTMKLSCPDSGLSVSVCPKSLAAAA